MIDKRLVDKLESLTGEKFQPKDFLLLSDDEINTRAACGIAAIKLSSDDRCIVREKNNKIYLHPCSNIGYVVDAMIKTRAPYLQNPLPIREITIEEVLSL